MAIFRLAGAARNELYLQRVRLRNMKTGFSNERNKKKTLRCLSLKCYSLHLRYTRYCGLHVIPLFYVFESDAVEALEGLIFLQ